MSSGDYRKVWPGADRDTALVLDTIVGPIFDPALFEDRIVRAEWSRVVLANPLLASYIVPAIGRGAAQ